MDQTTKIKNMADAIIEQNTMVATEDPSSAAEPNSNSNRASFKQQRQKK